MRTYEYRVLAGIEELRRHWGWMLAYGIAVIVLGAVSIIASRIATYVAVMTFGGIALAAGVLYILHAFEVRDWGGMLLSTAVGAIYFVTGLLLVTHPLLSALTLTLLMASYFVAMGVFRIVASLAAWFPTRGWVAFSGILSVILGVIVLRQMPVAALSLIGLFVGIELLFAGLSLTNLAMYVRSLPEIREEDIRMAA